MKTSNARIGRVMLVLCLVALFGVIAVVRQQMSSSLLAADPETAATHKFVKTVAIPQEDSEAGTQIHTFCVDKKGRLLASSGGATIEYGADENGNIGVSEKIQPAAIYVLAPDGTLETTWKLDFAPKAMTVAADGRVYVAGQGNVYELDENGKVVKSFESPHVKSLPPLPEIPEDDEPADAREARQKRMKELAAEIEKVNTKAEPIVEAYQKAKKSGDEDAKIKAMTAMEKIQSEIMPLYEEQSKLQLGKRQAAMQERARLVEAKDVKSLAVSTDAIYLCTPVAKGYGTEVWRVDLNGENPTVVVKNLSGCCGQMNISASGDKLIIPENGRMSVHVCDRDGKKLKTWGKGGGDDGDVTGFGSCCNPMNLTFDADGNVLTSEASVGVIKRFTQDGKYIETVAASKIVPGCKHTPIGLSPDGKTAYMLDIFQRQILLFAK
ncbi:MAG: hypothetical protein ACRC46_06415 [Thermoguttaceae bacterium]